MLKLALITIAGVPLGLVAQETVPTLPPWASWGVIGVVFGMLASKQLVFGWTYGDAKTEIKDLKAENSRLVNLALEIQKTTLPAIAASTAAVSEALTEIRALRGRQT